MKSFLGLGPVAWAASAVVHVGLAGGYVLAPKAIGPTAEGQLVIELITEEQPVESVATGDVDQATPIRPDSALADSVLFDSVLADSPPAIKPVRMAMVTPDREFTSLTVPAPPVAQAVQPELSAPIEPERPVEQKPAVTDTPVPDFDLPTEVALAPVLVEILEPVPALVRTVLEPVKVWLPKSKPDVPEQPELSAQEPLAPSEPELTLDQIASAAIEPAEPEKAKSKIEPEIKAVTNLAARNPETKPAETIAPQRQIASVVSPVVVRAGRLSKIVDPEAVAKVKGREAFRRARALPVGSVNPKPRYPRSARKRGYQGRVVLQVAVSFLGEPVDVNVVESTGHKVLDDAARRAVLMWKFEAARRAGVPIAGTVTTPIVFRLDN
jgi:periplasmic protein TonB